MGRAITAGSGIEAELAKHAGVEIHGNSLRIVFMWKRRRCRETLGLPVTKANIKHAAQLRAAVLHAIKIGTFDYAQHFPTPARLATTAAGATNACTCCWPATNR